MAARLGLAGARHTRTRIGGALYRDDRLDLAPNKRQMNSNTTSLTQARLKAAVKYIAIILSFLLMTAGARFQPASELIAADSCALPCISVPGLNQPDMLTLDSTGTLLYFPEELGSPSGSVNVLDLVAHTHTRLTTGLARPDGIVIGPNGNLFVSEENGAAGDVLEIDPISGAVLQTIGEGQFFNPEGVDFDTSGNLFVAEDTTPGDIFKVTFLPNGDVDSISTIATNLQRPEGLVVGLDGGIYVATTTDNRIIRIDPIDFEITPLVEDVSGFSAPDNIELTTDGRFVVSEDQSSGDIWIIEQDGPDADTLSDNVVKLLSGLTEPQGMAFSPDGTKLYVAQQGAVDTISAFSFSPITPTPGVSDPPLAGLAALLGVALVWAVRSRRPTTAA